MGSVREATDRTFDDMVLRSDKPVLVDFWGQTCAPCKLLAPVLEDLAASQDAIDVVKVEVDANPETARRYNVASMPVLDVFVGGDVVKRIVGAKPKSILLKELSEYLQVS